MPEWTPPSEFDGYRLVRPLGRGGMGQVFLGQDLLLERPVAVKFIAAQNPDESHRQRFIQEGRAIARLSHPNVVAIHRVGEVQGHPYFVAEYVRGQPLDAVTKPLPWERVLRIGRGLARGLAAAHRQGVLHRDLKPSNIVVTESGETKLLDFGLAKLITELEPVEENGDDTRTRDLPRSRADPSLTHPDLILGTPRYMAPEVLAGEPSSRRSDLFALGVVLFELCMGKAPDRSGDRALPPVRGMPGVNVRLAEIIDRCASVDPEQRFASADELLDALDHVVPERRELVLPEGNPYRGLRPFEAEHRALFFGRDVEIRAVLERLRSDARVVVAGDSGVGKSSLCRAGVLPLVNDGALGETSWRVVRLVPGRRPLVALAAALSPALEVNEEALGAWLSSEPAALARALQRARQKTPGFGLLVFVDQAEELFTLAPAGESGVVAEALGALGTTPHARVLLAVRGDFVTRLASLPGIGEELAASLYLLRPMTAEKLREVIVGPARARGFRYESDEMVERLVHSGLGSPGALPLLQFTLAELWEARNEELKVLPAAALDQVGGVEGALSRHADALLAALRPAQREEVHRILVRLVTAEGTRVRRTASELEARSGPAGVALDALVGARLVVAREIEGESTFELVHEALISGWGTLHEWLDEAADQRRLIQRLEGAATEWERLGQTREAVWRGRQLMEASSLDRASLGAREAAFLEHSRQERRRFRAWRAMGFAAAPLVLLGAVLLAQLRTRSQLDSRVSTHLEVARSAMDQGRALTAEALSGAREAFGLYNERAPSEPGTSRWDRAESRWAAALGARSAAESALARGVRALETAVLIDPSRQDVRQLLAEGTYRLIELGAGMDGSDPAPSLVQRLQTYDLSRRWIPLVEAPARVLIAVHPEDAHLRLERYRPIAGKLVPELVREGVAGTFGQVDLPAGSYLLVATAPGRHEVRDPFRVQSGATEELRFTLPDARAVGPDFVYVPPGKYLTGIRGNEELRKALGAPPLHEVRTEGYLIQRTEVTFGEYLDRIASMGPEGRQLRPHVTGAGGSVEVEQRPAGPWRARFEFSSARYSVSEGEPVVYATRKRLQSQDWRKFPVLGVSPSQARRYAALVADGRPTRLCRESEWERAARGADGRSFTLGERVEPTEANFDLSHGRVKGSMGPDQVDAHPESASPLGVLDLQGNAFEIVTSVHDDSSLLEKGGSWYHDLGLDGHLGARLAIDEETRSARLGFRLCADVAGETK